MVSLKLFSNNSQKPGLFYLYVRFTQCIKATVTCVQYGQNFFTVIGQHIQSFLESKLANMHLYANLQVQSTCIANSYTNAGEVMALQLKITVFITLLKIIHIQGFYRTFLFGLRCTLFINGNLPGTHIQAKKSNGLIITNN